jgi:hypothetical protein
VKGADKFYEERIRWRDTITVLRILRFQKTYVKLIAITEYTYNNIYIYKSKVSMLDNPDFNRKMVYSINQNPHDARHRFEKINKQELYNGYSKHNSPRNNNSLTKMVFLCLF